MLYEPERAGDDLGRDSRTGQRRGVHLLRFGGIAGHTGFGENVLAGGERRTSDLTMHVGPGPDAQGIDLWVIDDSPPVSVSLGDSQFPGSLGTRFARAIDDPRNGDAGNCPKSRNVAAARIRARSHDTHPNWFFRHRPNFFPASPIVTLCRNVHNILKGSRVDAKGMRRHRRKRLSATRPIRASTQPVRISAAGPTEKHRLYRGLQRPKPALAAAAPGLRPGTAGGR